MTDDNNQDPPKPKRRRKPPPGLEGFDTGFPEDTAPAEEPVSSGIPKKQLWAESTPTTDSADAPSSKASSPLARIAEAIPGAASPRSETVPVEAAAIESSQPASLSYPALQRESIVSTPIPVPIPASASGWASESGPTSPASSSSPSSSAPTSISTSTSISGGWSTSAESTPSGPLPASPSGSISASTPSPSDSGDPSTSAFASTSGVVTSPAPVSASGSLAMEPLPATLASASTDLRDAVGARPERRARTRTPAPLADSSYGGGVDDDDVDDDLAGDGGGKRRSRKTILVSVASLVVGLGVAALVFLGRANSSYYYITCEADQIIAQQGRAFPPWGESTLGGKQWAPIKIPPEAECIPLETEDETQLSDQFRTALVKRASALLTAKEVTKTDEANALLEQALLHARSNSDAARNARTEIQRLLGDVAYWRASLKMRDASKALLDAAKQFDAAAQQRPRHVTDASAWAEYVRKVVGELEAGPAGSTQTAFPPAPPPSSEQRPPAPPGVALPVEPDQGSAAEPPAPPPDAAMPMGGVLL